MPFRILIAAASIALLAGSALAQALIDARDPARILEVAQKFGSATLGKDKQGDPQITGNIDGVLYYVNFFNCTNGANCGDILLIAFWDPPAGASSTDMLNRSNFYNNEKLFGRAAVLADGDCTIDYALTLRGGVSTKNAQEAFDWFRIALSDYRKIVMKAGPAVSFTPEPGTADSGSAMRGERSNDAKPLEAIRNKP